MPRRHEISSAPENMVWGYIDSATPPVLEIASGDTVTLHSFPAGGKESLPEDKSLVPSDYLAALDTLVQGPGPHFITGPVYVKGARPGDVLQIDILNVKVRKDMDLSWPFAESATHLMSIGLDEDLDDAAKQAVREMVKHVCDRTNLSRNQAYMLCSLAGNLRVTQLVDGNKGIHMLLPKAYL